LKINLSLKRKNIITATLLVAIMTLSSFAIFTPVSADDPVLLDPTEIPKFTNQLTGPPPV